MSNESIKSLRSQAEELCEAGIANQEALLTALPVLTDLKQKAESAKKNLAAAVKAATMLTELCAAYALKHESVFDGRRLATTQQGVRVGDITTDEAVYHFASGYDGYMRKDPKAKMTQDFLAQLPETWRKAKYELCVTGINEERPSEEELDAHGLKQKPKNEWSLVEG